MAEFITRMKGQSGNEVTRLSNYNGGYASIASYQYEVHAEARKVLNEEHFNIFIQPIKGDNTPSHILNMKRPSFRINMEVNPETGEVEVKLSEELLNIAARQINEERGYA